MEKACWAQSGLIVPPIEGPLGFPGLLSGTLCGLNSSDLMLNEAIRPGEVGG